MVDCTKTSNSLLRNRGFPVDYLGHAQRFIDIEVSQGGRVLGGIETKLGSSAYTKAQRLKDAYLWVFQGYKVNVVRGPLPPPLP